MDPVFSPQQGLLQWECLIWSLKQPWASKTPDRLCPVSQLGSLRPPWLLLFSVTSFSSSYGFSFPDLVVLVQLSPPSHLNPCSKTAEQRLPELCPQFVAWRYFDATVILLIILLNQFCPNEQPLSAMLFSGHGLFCCPLLDW